MVDVSGIYCIENMSTHKKYIGQSKDIKDRWRRHISELNKNVHDNDYLQKAWNKYGFDDFKFYVLEYCEIDLLDEKEIYYINLFDTMDRNKGYNLTSGGQAYKTYSDEVKQKLSKSIKNSYNNSQLRQIRSDLFKKYYSDEDNKLRGDKNGMYGKHHTEESKQKISEHRKGVISWRRNMTPVICIELNQKYNDATDAGKNLKLDGSAILKVCKGERKTCGGYHWEFLNEENN